MRLIGLAVVLAGSLLLPLLNADAQRATKTYRSAVLANESSSAIDGLRHGLGDLGYLEGRYFKVDYAWAGMNSERFPALAADVVRQNPDFIVTWGTPGALAAKNATATIPIVMAPSATPSALGSSQVSPALAAI